jgi:protein-L-isoaspartate(D-aspartate) O-methyltransferase
MGRRARRLGGFAGARAMTAERSKRFPLALADLVKPDGVDSKSRAAKGAARTVVKAAGARTQPVVTAARPANAGMAKPGTSAAAAKPTPLVPAALRPPVKASAMAGALGRAARALPGSTAAALRSLAKPGAKQAKGATTAGAPKPSTGAKPATVRATPLSVNAFHTPAAKPTHAAGAKSSASAQSPTVKPLKSLSAHHRGTQRAPQPTPQTHHVLNSDRVRERMVERLRAGGIRDARVLAALAEIPRHQFVDAGLATQAYEDTALPIGHHQTISKPSVVARMIELATAGRALSKVLEIGTGCGYQAAVLSRVAREVYSIERIKPLSERAKSNLRSLRLPNLRLHYGDGRLGLPEVAPFDAILLAAAGLEVPQALLEQLAIGGRLIAPVGGEEQVLTLVERVAPAEWRESRLDRVFFVPLKTGVV